MFLHGPDSISVLLASFIKFDGIAKDVFHLEYFKMAILILLVESALDVKVSMSVLILVLPVSLSIWDALFS